MKIRPESWVDGGSWLVIYNDNIEYYWLIIVQPMPSIQYTANVTGVAYAFAAKKAFWGNVYGSPSLQS